MKSFNLPLSNLASNCLLPSGSGMSDHEIYARNLLSDKGFAPWNPGPVNIAEVGYVVRGGWIRLFDASKEPGDKINELGVPTGHYPLVVGMVDKRTLCGGLPITNEEGTSLEFRAKGPSSAMCVQCQLHKFPRCLIV